MRENKRFDSNDANPATYKRYDSMFVITRKEIFKVDNENFDVENISNKIL